MNPNTSSFLPASAAEFTPLGLLKSEPKIKPSAAEFVPGGGVTGLSLTKPAACSPEAIAELYYVSALGLVPKEGASQKGGFPVTV